MSKNIDIVKSLISTMSNINDSFESIKSELENIDYEYSDIDEIESAVVGEVRNINSLGFDLSYITEKLEDLKNELDT